MTTPPVVVDAHGHTLDLAFHVGQPLNAALGGTTDVPLILGGNFVRVFAQVVLRPRPPQSPGLEPGAARLWRRRGRAPTVAMGEVPHVRSGVRGQALRAGVRGNRSRR